MPIPEYSPNPIDTSSASLPQGFSDLAEVLAKNIHENWAQLRIGQGWKWGLERNDERKEHPCLVPYEQLSETEKDYDRQTSQMTLKTIVALGWKIER
jgi:hypothetical protein